MSAGLASSFLVGAIALIVVSGCGDQSALTEESTIQTPTKHVLSPDRQKARDIGRKVRQYRRWTPQDREFLERHMYDEDGDANKVLTAAWAHGWYKSEDYLASTKAVLKKLSGPEAIKYLDGYFQSIRTIGASSPSKPGKVTQMIIEKQDLDTLLDEEKGLLKSWLQGRSLAPWYDLGSTCYVAELLVSKKSFAKADKKWVSDLLKLEDEIAEREMRKKVDALRRSHEFEKDQAKLRLYEDDLGRMQLANKGPNEVRAFINEIVQGKPTK